MKKAILFYFVIVSHFQSSFLYLSGNELTIALGLSKKLRIAQCIFIDSQKNHTNVNFHVKTFSNAFIPTVLFSFETVFEFIMEKPFSFKTAFIFKGTNPTKIEELLSIFLNNETAKEWKIINQMSTFTWFAFVEDQKTIKNPKNNFTIPYDCEFIVIQPHHDHFKLTEVYKIENNTFFLDYGIWDTKSGLSIEENFFYARRSDLNGTEVRLLMYYELGYPETPLDREINKILFDWSIMMNFQYKRINFPNDDERDESFSDKLLESDFITGHASFLDYNSDYTTEGNVLFKLNINWYVRLACANLRPDFYIQPFQKNIWLAIIFSLTLGSIFAVFIQKRIPYQEKRCATDDLFMGLEYLCGQTGNDEIKNLPLRVASLSLSLISIIVTVAFGAVITSYMSVRIPDVPFVDLQSFFRNGEYEIAVDNIFDFLTLSRQLYNSIDTESYKKLEMLTKEKEIDKLCQEKLVFPDTEWKISEKNISCKLHQIDKPLGYKWVALELSRHNPLGKVLGYKLFFFSGSGILGRMKKIITKTSFKQVVEEEGLEPTELQQMEHVIAMPFIGALVATVIVFCELAYKKFKALLDSDNGFKCYDCN